LAPIYGYAPRGERLSLSVPRNRGKNTMLLSSMTLEGMGSSLAVEGATTARVFETHVEKVLIPSLEPGQIVVMDNLSAHRPKRIGELIEQKGCELLYLPSYSPDYNPIEQAFEDQEPSSQGRSQEQRVIGKSDSSGTLADHCRRRPGLLPACGIPSCGPTAVKRAISTQYHLYSIFGAL
jgi:DDE superfamily endonuclease